MSIKLKKRCLLLFLCFASLLHAQQREGNIVEYFGKEKVQDVTEGEVLHLFKEGLVLRMSGVSFSNASVENDPVFADALLNGLNIQKGKEVVDTFMDTTITWQPIEISENSEFNDRGLRRNGYLYLEYEAQETQNVLFEASGHTNAIINGLPHEGDHYDFGYSLIPVRLKKGINKFLLSGGRFPRMRARLLTPDKPVSFTKRDLTLPDLLEEEEEDRWGAVRIINAQEQWLKDASIEVKLVGVSKESKIPDLAPRNVRKVGFAIPIPPGIKASEEVRAILTLKDRNDRVIDTTQLQLAVKSKYKHHKNTFVSAVDGSVQYYSLAPSLSKDQEGQALFLSVHGASVEAVNQANAYKQKDWGHVVAPTNRRPFGFAWEDWGRLDALEVLSDAENLLKTDKKRTYLTGHSMGGHGTWYLGATYPDKFGAIAPAAGYPDLLGYRNSFTSRLTAEEFEGYLGMSMAEYQEKMGLKDQKAREFDSIIKRAGNPSRTLKLKNNYLHYGVYILHGDSDNVVPTFLAREMRERLGKYHNDFAYYEYPGGEHWFGDESVDWPPIFYFFNRRKVQEDSLVNTLDFSTGSPGVSASSHFISIIQQEKPFEISNFDFERKNDGFLLETKNIAALMIDLTAMQQDTLSEVLIDGQPLELSGSDSVYLKKAAGEWQLGKKPDASEKNPLRYGGFKDAFRHNVVFVYATKGSEQENEWYYNRAIFDAEKFWYRANGSISLVKDTDFKPGDYNDRNVILYGNKDNNAAWKKLLKNAPVQVEDGKVMLGDRSYAGDNYGLYFIYPRTDSDYASVGVVSATGPEGMKAAYANDYLENGTFYPDIIVFDENMPKHGLSGVRFSGFFGNDWSVAKGDFVAED